MLGEAMTGTKPDSTSIQYQMNKADDDENKLIS